MKRLLIINADDCNLTPGVTQAILDCHDRGIVTSTTFFVNLSVEPSAVRKIKKRKCLGVGLHLNITRGKPVSHLSRVKSLVDRQESFKSVEAIRESRLVCKLEEIRFEYENQILVFRKIFDRLPTHLDTHHQLHDLPGIFRVLLSVSKKHRLPIRRSVCLFSELSEKVRDEIRTTDFLFGSLNPRKHWCEQTLETVLTNLPCGISEIICHPGRNDAALRSVSSFTAGREKEWRLFRSSDLRRRLKQDGITLNHFGLLSSG